MSLISSDHLIGLYRLHCNCMRWNENIGIYLGCKKVQEKQQCIRLKWLKWEIYICTINMQWIKIHGRVSAAKKAVWRTSMLFTGTANSPFSTPHISITTVLISIKLTYFMPSIHTILHTNLKEIGLVDMCLGKLTNFLHIPLLLLLLGAVLQN